MGVKGKKAAAVAYDPSWSEKGGPSAPLVLAAGKGREAERIIAAAGEAGIAVVEDPALAVLLEAAGPGEIPPWCWEAAAKILAFVLEKERK
ncbi:MAG: EscU/YscU/HrcU family type III secretion system export apparatus switch protein [Treponema sp.]|jgi:flagellar biosynthesis protein|nr:EscU/YscU/HrcU family type III secretion system export apparatus switch protein [Treponema sp.]